MYKCTKCKMPINFRHFRSGRDIEEFHLSGMDQACIDREFPGDLETFDWEYPQNQWRN